LQVFLETDRLVLRRFTMADADDLFDLDGDPEVMNFITGGLPTPREEIENDVLPAFLRYYERGDRYGFWAAVEKSSGEFLGWFHFRPREGGRGVVAETMVVNAASRRVMEKAGLKYVRTFHQPWPYAIEGSEHGDVEYALRKADWERQQRTRRDPSPEVA
jgi:RimJ/RimL family protein N-acetyltransferase